VVLAVLAGLVVAALAVLLEKELPQLRVQVVVVGVAVTQMEAPARLA
jgi:hypothetical protein